MSALTWVALVLTLLIFTALLTAVRALERIEVMLGQLSKPANDAVHDTLHPVFSARQLRLSRQKFEHRYKIQLRLEKQLYESEAWLNRPKSDRLADGLRKQMRQVCEAIVEADYSWKEYEFMIGGNVAVANRGESALRVVEAFGTLLKETRETMPTFSGMLPRVNALFENWVARNEQPEAGIQPIGQEQLFREAWEDRAKWEHWEDFF